MRFDPFRPARLRASHACPFCAGLAAESGPLCNICQVASLRGEA